MDSDTALTGASPPPWPCIKLMSSSLITDQSRWAAAGGEASTGKLQRPLHIYQSLFIVFLQAAVCENVNGNWGVYTEGKETDLVCTSNITFIQYIIQASFNLSSGVETQQEYAKWWRFVCFGGWWGSDKGYMCRNGGNGTFKKKKKKKKEKKATRQNRNITGPHPHEHREVGTERIVGSVCRETAGGQQTKEIMGHLEGEAVMPGRN